MSRQVKVDHHGENNVAVDHLHRDGKATADEASGSGAPLESQWPQGSSCPISGKPATTTVAMLQAQIQGKVAKSSAITAEERRARGRNTTDNPEQAELQVNPTCEAALVEKYGPDCLQKGKSVTDTQSDAEAEA